MVDSMVPELELSPWDGDLEVVGSFSGCIPSAVERRPPVIAAAAGPPLADGSTRRKRLFLVEPLGMYVKNGHAVPENPGLSAMGSPAAAHDAAEPMPELARGAAPMTGGSVGFELRRHSFSADCGQTAAGTTLQAAAFALLPPAGGELPQQQQYQHQDHQHQQLHQYQHQQQQQYQHQDHQHQQLHQYQQQQQLYPQQYKQQQQQYQHQQQQLQPPPQQPSPPQPPPLQHQQSSPPELTAVPAQGPPYPGPIRRLASYPMSQFQGHPVAAARFQPYPHSRTSAGGPASAVPNRLVSAGGAGARALLPEMPALGHPPWATGSGGPPGGVFFTVLQRQGSAPWVREAGHCPPQQLLHGTFPPPPSSSRLQQQQALQESLPANADARDSGGGSAAVGPGVAARPGTAVAAAPTGVAAETLWHTWMRGEEVPLEEAGLVSGGGEQGSGGGGGAAASISKTGQAGGGALPIHAPLQGPVAAAPPLTAPLSPHQHQHLQQLLLQHQHLLQQQQQPAAPPLPRLPPASAAWSSGCAEIWEAAFGEPAPAVLPAHRDAPQLVDVSGNAAAGGRWQPRAGGVCAPIRASPPDPASRP